MDPIADQYAGYSPYNYVFGNPVRVLDPDGRGGWDVILAAYKYNNTAYEFGGKNPTYTGTSYSNLPDAVRSEVDESNQVGSRAWDNYGSDLGVDNRDGFNLIKSYGIDCSGLYVAGFNANPDLPSSLKLNPMNTGAKDLYDFFASNGNNSGLIGENGADFLSLDTDINSTSAKVGDALLLNAAPDATGTPHVATVGHIIRDKQNNLTGIYSLEATKPGDNVRVVYRTASELKKAGFSGYGIINQKESGSTKVYEKLQ